MIDVLAPPNLKRWAPIFALPYEEPNGRFGPGKPDVELRVHGPTDFLRLRRRIKQVLPE
jgi:hypothetical protein